MLERYQPGEPLPAETINRMADAIEANTLRPGVGYTLRKTKSGTTLVIDRGLSIGGAGAGIKQSLRDTYQATVEGVLKTYLLPGYLVSPTETFHLVDVELDLTQLGMYVTLQIDFTANDLLGYATVGGTVTNTAFTLSYHLSPPEHVTPYGTDLAGTMHVIIGYINGDGGWEPVTWGGDIHWNFFNPDILYVRGGHHEP